MCTKKTHRWVFFLSLILESIRGILFRTGFCTKSFSSFSIEVILLIDAYIDSSIFFTFASLAIPISAASWCSSETVAQASEIMVVVISLSWASRTHSKNLLVITRSRGFLASSMPSGLSLEGREVCGMQWSGERTLSHSIKNELSNQNTFSEVHTFLVFVLVLITHYS